MELSNQQIKQFQEKIWKFYKENRRDMPWRQTSDPYAIVVSEIMLQQTQVQRVSEKYPLWLEKFPTFSVLARASTLDVLQIWQGLGYNRRALYLKRTAELVMSQYFGELPQNPQILETFPGIGHATARSIIVFSFNKPEVFLETNIRRVFIHEFFEAPKEPMSLEANIRLRGRRPRDEFERSGMSTDRKIDDQQLLPLIQQTLDFKNPRDWYYALMDYGTFLAKQVTNPNQKSKSHTKQSKFEGSLRQVRGKIVKTLLLEKRMSIKSLQNSLNTSENYFFEALKQLQKEGFIKIEAELIEIANKT